MLEIVRSVLICGMYSFMYSLSAAIVRSLLVYGMYSFMDLVLAIVWSVWFVECTVLSTHPVLAIVRSVLDCEMYKLIQPGPTLARSLWVCSTTLSSFQSLSGCGMYNCTILTIQSRRLRGQFRSVECTTVSSFQFHC